MLSRHHIYHATNVDGAFRRQEPQGYVRPGGEAPRTPNGQPGKGREETGFS
jgi:hypothetical protein